MKQQFKTDPFRKTLAQLKENAIDHRKTCAEIAKYICPSKGRYLLNADDDQESDLGKDKWSSIINSTGTKALKRQAAGMQTGLTPKDRPWFVVTIGNTDLMKYAPVKQWLHDVRNVLLTLFAKSNFYDSMHSGYQELSLFGNTANLIEEDFQTGIRCRPFSFGEYYITLDSNYRPNGLHRQFAMKADQMVEKFGEENVTRKVREALEKNDQKNRYQVHHHITKNTKRDPLRGNWEGQAYISRYYEVANEDKDQFLEIKGYKNRPFAAPRWDVTGTDTWGEGLGHEILGDIRMIQDMEEKKLTALDKSIDPTYNAPIGMEDSANTSIAGGINFYDPANGGDGLRPVHEVRPDFNAIAFELERIEKRIKDGFDNDIFASFINKDKTMTAFEAARIHEEKLTLLGPVVNRFHSECIDVYIQRTFAIAEDLGMIPPAPKELEGQEFKIEYISVIAQAQKLIGIGSIERVAGVVGQMVEIFPEIRYKLDANEYLDEIANMMGTPPKIIRTNQQAQELLNQERQAQAQQQQQAQIMEMAKGAKDLGNIKMGEDSALDRVMEGMK